MYKTLMFSMIPCIERHIYYITVIQRNSLEDDTEKMFIVSIWVAV